MNIMPVVFGVCQWAVGQILRAAIQSLANLTFKRRRTMSNPTEGLMTLGQVADNLGVQVWRVRRLYERGILPEPPRFQRSRLVRRDDLPAVKEALEKAGYL